MNKPGQLALIADPYCYVLDNVNCGFKCDNCFRDLDPEKKVKCFRCKYTSYCNDECKLYSYNEIHDVECEFLRRYNKKNPVDVKIRLWARLLIRNFKGISNVSHEYEVGKFVTFDTLTFPYAAMKDSVHFEKDYKDDCLKLVEFFISRPEMISNYTADYLETMYLRMRYATLRIKEDPFKSFVSGYGIYLLATLIRCKCQPNSVFKFTDLRLVAHILEEIPDLRSLTQVTVGKQGIFGFSSSDDLVREYLDCSCDTCRGQQIELIKCQNSQCNFPFLVVGKNCPKCNAKVKPKFLKKYSKLRPIVLDLIRKRNFDENSTTLEAATKVYEDFAQITHFCNTLKLQLQSLIFKTIRNRERVMQLEFLTVYYHKLKGTYDFTRVMSLIHLTKYYCRMCHKMRLLQIHYALRTILPILASTEVPSYIENETMLKEVANSRIEDYRCTCNDINEFIF